MSKAQWFTRARFGLFIHWGLYTLPGRGEWIFARSDWQPGEYEKLMEKFNPSGFDPYEWARLAKAAGMKYVVFTTKHHDGFCMYDSCCTEYKVTNTAYGKDVLAMLLEAFRAEGLRVGLYHSLPDWTHPGYADEESPEYIRHQRLHTPTAEEHRAFCDYLYNQVECLMTRYGKIDLLFFDYTSRTKKGMDYFDRKRILEMVYRHQPDILVNDRLTYEKEIDLDFDYYTPEVAVMNQPLEAKGKPVAWESCATINGFWGHVNNAGKCRELISLTGGLAGCVSVDGNLLLNVAPDAEGRFSPEATARLTELARWFESNGESITGCGKAAYPPPFGSCYTAADNILYCHLFFPPIGDMILPQLKGKVESISLLRTGETVEIVPLWGYELLKEDDLRIRVPLDAVAGDVLRIVLK